MDNDLNKPAGTDFATLEPAAPAASQAATPATEAMPAMSASAAISSSTSSARVKRMRGWLGVKSSTPSYGHGDDGGPVSYGDAPNGWNR